MNFGVFIVVPLLISTQYLTCGKCGRRVSTTFNYCVFCGSMLHPERVWAYASKICKSCKKEIPMLVRFCPVCGQKQ